MEAQAQEIEVGPVRVDTGNDWMDFGFVLIILILIAVLGYIFRPRL
jgi:hypothetical protein